MNQFLLSAVFLQKVLSYQPRIKPVHKSAPIERSWNKVYELKKQPDFAEKTLQERNHDFFRRLARSKKNNTKVLKAHEILFPPDKGVRGFTTLIIAPHPDDEILGTANLIKEKLKSRACPAESNFSRNSCGEKVKIIYLTNGDAMGGVPPLQAQAYGHKRILESQRATQKLGLKKSDLYFLGFPDAYSDKLPETGSLQSRFTGRNKTYRDSFFPNLKYSRDSLKRAFRRLINKIQPDEIYFTSHDDNNVDHAVVSELLPENPAKKFTYTIHRSECPNEICPCDQEIDQNKLDLIKIFQSQRFTSHHEEFLDQFACQKEVFKEVE